MSMNIISTTWMYDLVDLSDLEDLGISLKTALKLYWKNLDIKDIRGDIRGAYLTHAPVQAGHLTVSAIQRMH